MRLTICTDERVLTAEEDGRVDSYPLYSPQAFELLSKQWLKVGWDQKYSYSFSWFGRPVIQLPEDLIRMQEVIYRVKPDVIVETGIAHGGSLVYYASLCKALGKGRIVGVDIDIRAVNRAALEAHDLSSYITLIEGDSTDEAIVEEVAKCIAPGEKVLVILDSCHTKAHVAGELNAYSPLVTPGSYLVVTDGIMRDLHDVPSGVESWDQDHPVAAALGFVRRHDEFVIEQPTREFDESSLKEDITYWPSAWLRRKHS